MPRLRLHGCLYHPVKPTNDNSKQALAVTGPPKLQNLGGFLSNVIGQVQALKTCTYSFFILACFFISFFDFGYQNSFNFDFK